MWLLSSSTTATYGSRRQISHIRSSLPPSAPPEARFSTGTSIAPPIRLQRPGIRLRPRFQAAIVNKKTHMYARAASILFAVLFAASVAWAEDRGAAKEQVE